MKEFLVILSAFLLLISCNKSNKSGAGTESDDNIVKEYYANGVIKTEITVQDSLRHGPTSNYNTEGQLLSVVNYVNNVKEGTVTNYYVPSGNISSTFEYKEGIKQGDEIWYYESGKEYRITPYVDGKMNGIQKYYYEGGQLMAEVPWKDNYPGKGLKEYREDGSLIDDYPTIVVTKEDHLATANSVLLKFTLSNKSSNVKFYRGNPDGEGYLSEDLAEMATQGGMTQILLNLPKGARVDQNVRVSARFETRFGNPFVTNTSYHLQIFNSL